MTDRDEVFDLSRIICANSSATFGESDTAAQAVLDAGYRKPRTITNLAQLEAAPIGTVIRSAGGTIGARFDDHYGVVFGDDRPYRWGLLALPATVLYTPEEQS